jgi:hypothetical protein
MHSMKPDVAAATRSRPNRLLVALAAAWMILSLAIGGAVTAESRTEITVEHRGVTTASQ